MGRKCHERFYIDIMNLNREVTGSSIPLTIHYPNKTSKHILIDCGLFQEEEYEKLNNFLPFSPNKIDHVIVTHNHIDHTGRLPLLVKNDYTGKIHTSEPTSHLISNALEDSCKVIKSKAKMFHQSPFYSDSDVKSTMPLIVPHPFEETFELDENTKLTFYKNGHLPGAVVGHLQFSYHDYSDYDYDDIHVLFTGDYNNKNMFFEIPSLPKELLNLPINIIQEATYGNMFSSQIEYVFEKNILDAIAEGKSIVIPVFSLGRSQEIMYVLKQYQEQGKLDPRIPIYYDGKLGIRYTQLFIMDLLGLDVQNEFIPDNFIFVTDSVTRNNIINDTSTKIILTTSGMGSHGPAQAYLPAYLPRKNALIHFTGYVAEGTLGRRLYDCPHEDIVSVGGRQVKKLADVQFTTEFSAHAKADELLDFLKQFTNIKTVFINHGSTEAQQAYGKLVVNTLDPKDVCILNAKYAFRINAHGLIKTFSTRFD